MRKEKYGIGTIHQTKLYGEIKVIGKVKDNCRLRVVLFLDTSNKQTVSMSTIGIGNVVDKGLGSRASRGVYSVGKIFNSNNYGKIEIVEIINQRRRKVKFLNTNAEIEADLASIKSGRLRDKTLSSVFLGSIHETNNCGKCEVIEMGNQSKRKVKFLNTGTVKWVYDRALLSGAIFDGIMNKYRVGSIHETKKHGKVKIIRMGVKYNCRIVKFLKYGTEKKVTVAQLVAGNLSCIVQLSSKEVHEICKELKYGLKRQYEIADKYNVTSPTISAINRGISYTDITNEYKYKYEKRVRGSIRQCD